MPVPQLTRYSGSSSAHQAIHQSVSLTVSQSSQTVIQSLGHSSIQISTDTDAFAAQMSEENFPVVAANNRQVISSLNLP